MATPIICPRCHSELPSEQTTCPTCVLKASGTATRSWAAEESSASGGYQPIGHAPLRNVQDDGRVKRTR